MTSPDYFDDLYAEKDDPWDLADSAYEQRKLALLLAALPRRRYRSAFEPGCSIGVTSAALSERCERLLAMDAVRAAVAAARSRVDAAVVTVVQGRVPDDWPDGVFDLVIISELLYYLGDDDRRRTMRRAAQALPPGGDLVAVHWRHAFAAAPVDGQTVHTELTDLLPRLGVALLVDQVEPDFRLQVYRRGDA